jgi:hypothetical protein
MTWADLIASAYTRNGGALFVLDRALIALAASRDPFLNATVVAATPGVHELCHLLDLYRVPVPRGDETLAHGDDARIAVERFDQLEVRASSAPDSQQ